MSKSNPKKAIEALLPQPIKTRGGVVNPIMLATYALLEYTESPMLFAQKAKILELIPTLYILTHDAVEISRDIGSLVDKSIAWASGILLDVMPEIELAAKKQIEVAFQVIDLANKKKAQAETDGSQQSRSGRAKATDGATNT